MALCEYKCRQCIECIRKHIMIEFSPMKRDCNDQTMTTCVAETAGGILMDII